MSCGPCRAIAPRVEAVAEKYADRLKLVRVNIDEQPALASSYGIQGIPTLLFFKDGEIVDTIVGAAPQEKIENKVEDLL